MYYVAYISVTTTTTIDVHNSDDIFTKETGPKLVDVGVQTKLTGEKLDKTLQDLRRDQRILQQKLIRSDDMYDKIIIIIS